MPYLIGDLLLAARSLRRTPTFTIAAITSLAIGLALATTTVSVVNAYLIRALPYAAGERLYHVRYAPPGPWEPRGMTAIDWTSIKDAVEFPIGAASDTLYLSEGGATLPLRAMRVTPGFVDGLGVSVVAGRRFGDTDFDTGSESVGLIGYALWRDRFASDPSAIGRIIRVESESRPGTPETFRIVGVLTPGFYFGRDRRATVDLVVPNATPLRVYMVRLAAGTSPAAAERRLTEAARRAATAPIPESWTGVHLESVRDRSVGDLRPVLFGVTLAVALVLIIVCTNVAVLVLLRSMQRRKEVAVRLALGSGWHQIARMLLAETALVCAVALVVGIAITGLTLAALAPQIEAQLGRPAPTVAGITIDTTVLMIVGGVSIVIAILLSLAPLRSWGRGLTNALQQDARTASEGPSMRHLRRGLIAFEIAGALVLLVGCGLMLRSVVDMLSTDLGIDSRGLTTSRIMLRARDYPDAAAYRQFHERFADRLSSLTGSTVVFSTWPWFVAPPTNVIEPDTGTPANAGVVAVSANYFSTFGIQLRQGREFTREEASGEAPVAVVSDTLAQRLWPAGTALGRRVRAIEQTTGGSTPGPWRTVVGVASDVRQTYDDQDRSDFYVPKTPDGRYSTFYLRSNRAAARLIDDFQRTAAEIDRNAVINPPRRVADDDQALAGTRFLTVLASALAALAGVLAMLGIYAVIAYAVQQRYKEIAIRMALGASDRAVVRIFVREGAWVLLGGAIAGLVGGAVLARLLQHQVFGLRTVDVATFAIACSLLLVAGFVAVLTAARHAALSDPASTLNAG